MALLSARAASALALGGFTTRDMLLPPLPSAPGPLSPIPSARYYYSPSGASKRARLLVPAPPPAAAAAAGAASPAPAAGTAAARAVADADALLESTDLVLPSVRHQAPLARDALRALRAESEELAKKKRLVRVQVGAKGLNAAVVASAADALAGAPSGLVRVRLGEGCGLERRSAAVAMERLLDAVCVKQVGFCVTLYRDKGLPRPDNVPASAVPVATGPEEDEAAAAAPAAAAAMGEAEPRPAATGRKSSGKAGGGRKKSPGDGREGGSSSSSSSSSAAAGPKPPPAFTVV